MVEAKREYEFLYMLGLRGAVKILKYLKEHEKGRYKDFHEQGFIVNTLNVRIRELIALGLISHNITLLEKRKEWYELTERGEKVLKLILELEKIIKEVDKNG